MEMMIVVSIVSFLALIATSYLRSQVFKGYDARRKMEVKRISVAIEEYEKDNDCYPPPNLVSCEGGGTGLRPYIDHIPCDPVSNTSYYYQDDSTSCSKWYTVYADLQNENDSDYIPNIGPSANYSFYLSSSNAPEIVEQFPDGTVIFHGCFSGVCREIAGTSCTPNYGSTTCSGQCGTSQNPLNECVQY